MELSQEDKDRIIAEEKLRMETRKEFVRDHFGGGNWRGPWGGWHGCGWGCRGFGFLKALLLILVVFGLFHLWHHPCGRPYDGYGYCPPAAQAPAPQPPPSGK